MRYLVNHYVYYFLICLIVSAGNCGQKRIEDAHKKTPLIMPPADLTTLDQTDINSINEAKKRKSQKE